MAVTLYHKPNRQPWFRGHDGVLTTTQREDETETYVFDYADRLDSGVTISTSAWEANGVTTSGASATTTTTTITVAGTNGDLVNKLTLSNSNVLEFKYRFTSPVESTQRDMYS